MSKVEYTTEGKRLYLTAPYSFKDEIKVALEARKWDPQRRQWHCRDSARNRYVITQVWEDTELFGRYYNDGWQDVVIPDPPIQPGYKWHQIERAKKHVYRRGTIDTSDMGLMKTRTYFAAIEGVAHLLGRQPRVWWCSSKRGIDALKTQYAKWRPNFRPVVISTWDSIEKHIARHSVPPEVLILDEIHALKGHKTQRFQSMLGLRELMEDAYGYNCWVIGGSGTPQPKDLLDWWSMCEVVRPGFIREGSYYVFRDRYFIMEEVTFAANKVRRPVEPSAEANHFARRIAGLAFGHGQEALDVPLTKLTREIISIEPSPEVLRICQAIANSGETALKVLQQTMQVADGFIYEGTTTHRVPTPKDDVVRRLLEQEEEYNGGKRFIIWANFRDSIDRVQSLVRDSGWKAITVDGRGWRGESLQSFQMGSGKVCLVGHPRSGGEGIDLTAANKMLFYSNGFNAGDRMQAEKRINRPGQRRPVTIFDISYLPTDDYVLENLMAKKEAQEYNLDILRGLFRDAEEEGDSRKEDSWLAAMK